MTINKTFTALAGALAMGGAMMASTGEAKAWGYYGYGYGGDAAIAAGVVGGLALGAIAADAAARRQPVYVGQRGYRSARGHRAPRQAQR